MYLYLKPIIKIRIFEVLYRDLKKIPLFISNYYLILYLNNYSYTKEYLFKYYLLIYLLSNLSIFQSYYFEKKIELNQIGYIVIKPYSLFLNRFIVFFTKNVVSFIIAILEIGIFLISTHQLTSNLISVTNAGSSLVLLIIGILIGFYMFLCISFTKFWFKNINNMYSVYYLIMGILSGMFFPLEILSKYSRFIEFSPFAYLYYLPAKNLLHRSLNTQPLIVVGVIWILVFYCLSKYIYEKGLVKYNNSNHE